MQTIIDLTTNKRKNICDNSEELCQIITDTINYYKEQRDAAEHKANKTREEVMSSIQNEFEKENKQLKEKLHLSYGSFHTEKELENWNAFIKKHKDCWCNSKFSSSRYFYIKTYGTGFGIGVIACCPHCGEEKDISDSSWW